MIPIHALVENKYIFERIPDTGKKLSDIDIMHIDSLDFLNRKYYDEYII